MQGMVMTGASVALAGCLCSSSTAATITIDPVKGPLNQYEAEAIPTFPGFPFPRVSDINNQGKVAGTNFASPFILSSLSQTFLYDGNTLMHTSAEIIGAVPDPFVGIPTNIDLNDADQVLLRLAVPDVGVFHYLWDEENGSTLISGDPDDNPDTGPLVPIPPPPGTSWEVNNQGVVVGTVGPNQPGGDGAYAFLWTVDTGVTTVINPPRSFSSIGARAINNSNQVVGTVSNGIGVDVRGYMWDNGEFTILPPLPGHLESQAVAINDDGFVAGTSRGPSAGNFVYSLVLWHDGKIIDSVSLDFPGGLIQMPMNINANNAVSGYYWPTAVEPQHFGFIWTPIGGFQQINGSITNEPDLNIWAANGINDAGQLATWGEFPDFSGGAFILNPVEQTTPGDLDGDGDVDGQDLLMFLNAWGTADPNADLDVSGTVSGADLLILLNNWG